MSSGLPWNSDCVYLYLHVWSNIFMFEQMTNIFMLLWLECLCWTVAAVLHEVDTNQECDLCLQSKSHHSRAVCLYPCKNYRLWTILNLTTTNLIVTTSLVQTCSCCHKNNQSGWNQSVSALLVCHCWRLQCGPTWSPVIMVTLTRTSTAFIVETKSQYCISQ